MKQVLFAVALLMVSFSSFAGTLTNRSTGEKVVITVDEGNQSIHVVSNSSQIETGDYLIGKMPEKKSFFDSDEFSSVNSANPFYVTVLAMEEGFGIHWSFVVVPPLAAVLIPDLITLPVRGPLAVALKIGHVRNYKKIMRMAYKGTNYEVSSKRFKKIVNIIQGLDQ